jgi:hypothetical protein
VYICELSIEREHLGREPLNDNHIHQPRRPDDLSEDDLTGESDMHAEYRYLRTFALPRKLAGTSEVNSELIAAIASPPIGKFATFLNKFPRLLEPEVQPHVDVLGRRSRKCLVEDHHSQDKQQMG